MGFHNAPEESREDYYAKLALPNATLPIVRLNAKAESIIRILPEHDAAGNPVPAVIGKDGNGYIWSNLDRQDMIAAAGERERTTRWTKSADRPQENDKQNPWNMLFMYAKGQFNAITAMRAGKPNKTVIDPHSEAIMPQLTALLANPAKGNCRLQSPATKILCEGVVMKENGTSLATPKKAIIVMGNSVRATLINSLTSWVDLVHADPFAYATGCALRIFGVPGSDGGGATLFNAELNKDQTGQSALPVPPEWRVWTPYEQVLNLYTYEDHIRTLVACYGAALVAHHPRLAEELARYGIPIPQASAVAIQAPVSTQPVYQAPAPIPQAQQAAAHYVPQQPAAPTVQASPFAALPPQPSAFQSPAAPVPPAPAPAGGLNMVSPGFAYPAPVPPAPAPAGGLPGFGQPTAPQAMASAFSAPPAPAPAASAFSAPPAATTPAAPPVAPLGAQAPTALEAQYAEIMAKAEAAKAALAATQSKA